MRITVDTAPYGKNEAPLLYLKPMERCNGRNNTSTEKTNSSTMLESRGNILSLEEMEKRKRITSCIKKNIESLQKNKILDRLPQPSSICATWGSDQTRKTSPNDDHTREIDVVRLCLITNDNNPASPKRESSAYNQPSSERKERRLERCKDVENAKIPTTKPGTRDCVPAPRNVQRQSGWIQSPQNISEDLDTSFYPQQINQPAQRARRLSPRNGLQAENATERTHGHASRPPLDCRHQAQRTPSRQRHKDDPQAAKGESNKIPHAHLKYGTMSDYDSISMVLRYNLIPGVSMRTPESVARSTYTNEVYRCRVPETDEFKYKKNEYSK